MDRGLDDIVTSDFEIHENILLVNVDLYWENLAKFCDMCDKLLDQSYDSVVLDLTNVSFVFSAYMATIGKVLADAAKSGKQLNIRIRNNLKWLFEIAGFDKMINVEVVC